MASLASPARRPQKKIQKRYKRPDVGRKRDRRGYKRPDAGKRPKTHSGATGSSRYRKSGGNKQSTGRATHNQRMKREGAFIVKEEQEEEKKGDRGGYKRPDAGKRPKTHRGATGSSISRKKRGNKQKKTHTLQMAEEGFAEEERLLKEAHRCAAKNSWWKNDRKDEEGQKTAAQ